MNIHDASRITAISKDMIRYYEKIGLIKPSRKENGYRDFSEDDLNTLVSIRTLSNSNIPLRQIRAAFQTDSVDNLVDGLSMELENIHRIQRQIDAREHAVMFELQHMLQYREHVNPVLCHYPDRWIVVKNSRMDSTFDQKLDHIVNAGEYIQYVACYDVDFHTESVEAIFRDQGILLYNQYPNARHIPAQNSLRFIATHEAGRMLSSKELVSFARSAMDVSDKKQYEILAYQFFRCMGEKEECVVCVEVLLGQG